MKNLYDIEKMSYNSSASAVILAHPSFIEYKWVKRRKLCREMLNNCFNSIAKNVEWLNEEQKGILQDCFATNYETSLDERLMELLAI